ncbi:MAG: hypothetical protein JXA30_20075 [Deltaproteobacteria bacterium]|nr:hypothetical protein [Deltaproteobacteria bacterium]
MISKNEDLKAAIADRSAEVVALSWRLQQEPAVRTMTRRAGVLLLLWAHPLDMQARSGHSEPLFTPVRQLRTKAGFGRTGTGCREFRQMNRTCDETVLLVDAPYTDASEYLRECIISIREEVFEPPAIREGLIGWVEDWRQDYNANQKAAEVFVDAMARYTLYLKSQGASPRKISGVYSDLNAAGILTMMYDATKGRNRVKILSHFYDPPWTYEFSRKFSDSSNAARRYRKNLEGFSRFLRQSGMVPMESEE